MTSFTARVLAAASAASLLISTPVAAAPVAGAAKAQTLPRYSAWAMLAATASPASAAALCGTSAATAAAAMQQSGVGCVLPAVDAPPPVATSETAAAVPAASSAAASSLGVLPLLLGLAGLAGAAALLLSSGNGNDDINVGQPIPVSP